MNIINRPFIKITSDSPARAILPVVLKDPATNQEMRTFGIIDTGADDCAFPASFALITGHNLGAGIVKEVNTGNGITIAYSHTISLEVDGYKIENILIDFMPNLFIPLLGVQNFLKNFVLTVDYPKQTFSLIKN